MAAAGVRVALVVAVLAVCGGGLAAAAENLVPGVYVFGDSTVDVGNNGPLELPYGIDLPHNSLPTGRVSNGYNVADYISRQLGFKNSPPAYLSVTPNTSRHREILRGVGGVSYASGGSGILNTTRIMPNSISMAEQVEFFAATKSQMTQYAGGKGSSVDHIHTLLSKSLFLISAGGNDFFLHLQKPESWVTTFHKHLVSNYTTHVHALYDLGARRFGIVGVPPVGCVPLMRKNMMFGGCFLYANQIANQFNSMLGEMMANFAADPEMPGLTYSVASSYNLVMNITRDPEAAGFSNVTSACCGDGKFGAETFCLPNATVCDNRASYLYWDFAHSTQATAEKGAALIFNAPVEEGFAAPINFKQLVSSTPHGFDPVSTS